MTSEKPKPMMKTVTIFLETDNPEYYYILKLTGPHHDLTYTKCGVCGRLIKDHPKESDGTIMRFGVNCSFTPRQKRPGGI